MAGTNTRFTTDDRQTVLYFLDDIGGISGAHLKAKDGPLAKAMKEPKRKIHWFQSAHAVIDELTKVTDDTNSMYCQDLKDLATRLFAWGIVNHCDESYPVTFEALSRFTSYHL